MSSTSYSDDSANETESSTYSTDSSSEQETESSETEESTAASESSAASSTESGTESSQEEESTTNSSPKAVLIEEPESTRPDNFPDFEDPPISVSDTNSQETVDSIRTSLSCFDTSIRSSANSWRNSVCASRCASEAEFQFEVPVEVVEESLTFDDAEVKAEDAEIDAWMANEKESHMNEYGMNTKQIHGIREIQNPMTDPLAVTVSQLPGFQDDRIVKLLSHKVKVIDFNPQLEEWRSYSPSRELTYMDEIDAPVQRKGNLESFSVAGSYTMGFGSQRDSCVLKLTRTPELTAKDYVTIKVTGFGLKGKPIEPVVCTACLYTEKTFISEEWNFVPDFSIDMFQRVGVSIMRNHEVAIEIPRSEKPVSLVFILSHILTVDANEPINKYYLQSKLESAAKKNLNATWPRNKEVFTTFGWACLDLNEILNSEKVEVNGFHEIKTPFIAANMKKKVQDVLKSKKDGKYPFQIKMDIARRSAIHEQELLNDGLKLVRLVLEKPKLTQPVFTFSHRMQVRIFDASLKVPSGVKARNIFGEVSLRVGSDGLPLKKIYNRYGNGLVDKVVTRCWYHHANEASFDELFVFDLPLPVDQDLCIVIEFFHAIAKANPKGNAVKSYIGQAVVPVLNAGRAVDNSIQSAPIHYKKKGGGGPKNSVQVQVSFDSSILSSDVHLSDFFLSGGSEAKSLSLSDPNEIMSHFLGVIDAITNTLGEKPKEAIGSLVVLSSQLEPILHQKLNSYLTFFAETYADFPKTAVINRSIIDAWTTFMERDTENKDDGSFIGYLLAIIAKLLMLTGDRQFGTSYASWLVVFARKLASMQTENGSAHFAAFARFTNILFDNGYYRYAIQTIASFVKACLIADNRLLDQFLVAVLRPKILYSGLLKFPLMKETVLKLVRHGVSVTTRSTVFHVLLSAFSQIPKEGQEKLVNECLYESIAIMSPLNSLRFVRSSLFHAVLLFYSFLLGHVIPSPEFMTWWTGTCKEHVFKSLHFLLDQAVVSQKSTGPDRVKEMTFAIHRSILNFLRVIKEDLSSVTDISCVIYHMLWVNICVDSFTMVVDLLCDMITSDVDYVLRFSNPALPKFVIRLLKHSGKNDCVSKFLSTLFAADKKAFNSTERSMAVCCRALALMPHSDLSSIRITSTDPLLTPLKETIETLVFVGEHITQPNITLEYQLSLAMKRIWALKPSPDATVQELMNLAEFHREHGYFEEEIQTQMLALTFIIEYLSVQRRIKLYWGELHAAKCFDGVCTNFQLAIYPHDECPTMNGYCDSTFFSFRSLVSMVLSLRNACVKNKRGYEEIISFIDIMWPIYEDNADWLELVRFFKLQMVIMRDLAAIPETTDRLFGQYFRVAFYGTVFGNQNGCTYIYHEKGLTHLYEFSSRLIEDNERMFGTPIELIKESGKVDTTKLDPSKCYIQITSVKPHFSKDELRVRSTSYDMSHNLKAFFFDTPFTKNSGKAQGGIDEQWIKRTILICDNCMPSVSKVELIRQENIQEREFSPIRVSYRMLRERVSMIDSASDAQDYQKLQQLLHGSLLAQVNEGPTKIAEVFLAKGTAHDKKYVEKMRRVFSQFLSVCKKGLAVHAEWVNSNTAFRMLQDTLETSYSSLEMIIGHYLQ